MTVTCKEPAGYVQFDGVNGELSYRRQTQAELVDVSRTKIVSRQLRPTSYMRGYLTVVPQAPFQLRTPLAPPRFRWRLGPCRFDRC